jgi:hypothetical protein
MALGRISLCPLLSLHRTVLCALHGFVVSSKSRNVRISELICKTLLTDLSPKIFHILRISCSISEAQAAGGSRGAS